VHPTPHTPHPTLCTLHLTPYTLHPSPYTLHATHYTPHPTPHTHRALGIGLPQGPRARRFLMSEVPLYHARKDGPIEVQGPHAPLRQVYAPLGRQM
jgi:hypothetical protein